MEAGLFPVSVRILVNALIINKSPAKTEAANTHDGKLYACRAF